MSNISILSFYWSLVSLVSLAFGYESGKEYKHKLEAYVHTSIRNSKNQFSGTATIGDVIIQVQSDNYLIKVRKNLLSNASLLSQSITEFDFDQR